QKIFFKNYNTVVRHELIDNVIYKLQREKENQYQRCACQPFSFHFKNQKENPGAGVKNNHHKHQRNKLRQKRTFGVELTIQNHCHEEIQWPTKALDSNRFLQKK